MRNLFLAIILATSSFAQAGVVEDLVTNKISTDEAVSQIMENDDVESAISKALQEAVELEKAGKIQAENEQVLANFSAELISAVEDENTSRTYWNGAKRIGGFAAGYVVIGGAAAIGLLKATGGVSANLPGGMGMLQVVALAGGAIGVVLTNKYLVEDYLSEDIEELAL